MASDTAPVDAQTSGRRTGRIVLGVVIVLIGLLALLAALGRFVTEESSTGTFADVTRIELDLSSAAVTITGGGEDLVVEKEVSVGLLGGSSREEQTAGTLRLVHRCRWLLSIGCGGTYRLTVPSGTEIVGGTSNGALSVTGTDGPIDIRTSNGAIDLDGLSGDFAVHTANGAVEGSGLAAERARVSTSNGRVDLAFESGPTLVEVRTSNGRIDLTVPPDSPPYALNASTSNGQVQNDIRTDPAAEARLDLETSNGDIVVGYR